VQSLISITHHNFILIQFRIVQHLRDIRQANFCSSRSTGTTSYRIEKKGKFFYLGSKMLWIGSKDIAQILYQASILTNRVSTLLEKIKRKLNFHSIKKKKNNIQNTYSHFILHPSQCSRDIQLWYFIYLLLCFKDMYPS